MYRYTFKDGTVVTSKLNKVELINRMKRLDILRVITEQHDCKEGRNICSKALKAYDKVVDFTGIIRLTFIEKDWLAYLLESDFLNSEDKEVINYYIR